MTIQIAEGILATVCHLTGYRPETIRAKTRIRDISRARAAVMFSLRERTAWSLPQIARYVGLTDHTSVMHSVSMTPIWMDQNDRFRALVESLLAAPPITAFSLESVIAVNTKPAKAAKLVPGLLRTIPPVKAPPRRKVFVMVEPEVGQHFSRGFLVDEEGRSLCELTAEERMAKGSKKLAAAVIGLLIERRAAA